MQNLVYQKDIPMSQEAVELFYQELAQNPILHRKALALQQEFSRQEDLINAFIALGASNGFHFSEHELIRHIFTNGKAEK